MRITAGLRRICQRVNRTYESEYAPYKDGFLFVSKIDDGVNVKYVDIIGLDGMPDGNVIDEFDLTEEDI